MYLNIQQQEEADFHPEAPWQMARREAQWAAADASAESFTEVEAHIEAGGTVVVWHCDQHDAYDAIVGTRYVYEAIHDYEAWLAKQEAKDDSWYWEEYHMINDPLETLPTLYVAGQLGDQESTGFSIWDPRHPEHRETTDDDVWAGINEVWDFNTNEFKA